jgi:hypothetical protein
MSTGVLGRMVQKESNISGELALLQLDYLCLPQQGLGQPGKASFCQPLTKHSPSTHPHPFPESKVLEKPLQEPGPSSKGNTKATSQVLRALTPSNTYQEARGGWQIPAEPSQEEGLPPQLSGVTQVPPHQEHLNHSDSVSGSHRKGPAGTKPRPEIVTEDRILAKATPWPVGIKFPSNNLLRPNRQTQDIFNWREALWEKRERGRGRERKRERESERESKREHVSTWKLTNFTSFLLQRTHFL